MSGGSGSGSGAVGLGRCGSEGGLRAAPMATPRTADAARSLWADKLRDGRAHRADERARENARAGAERRAAAQQRMRVPGTRPFI